MKVRRLPTLALLSAAFLFACGKTPTELPPGGNGGNGGDDPVPTTLELVAGDGQTARIQTPVTVAPAVKVKDQNGGLLRDVEVEFRVTGGGGELAGAITTTDAAGVARLTSWTLGQTKTTNSVEARVTGLAPVHFSAEARYPHWTVMVYMAADNSLSEAGVFDLEEMESAPRSPEVQTVLQAEFSEEMFRRKNCDASCIGMSNFNTFRYAIGAAAGSILGPDGVTVDIGNRDLTDPSEIRQFVLWAQDEYPAENYALVLWNHGGAIAGLLEDQTSNPGEFMTLAELPAAFQGVERIHVLEFDMCLMAGYETLVMLNGVTDYAVFSEENEPGEGDPFDRILGYLVTSPSASPRDLASTIVTEYHASYSGHTSPTTKSAYDLAEFARFEMALDQVADYLRLNMVATGPLISAAVGASQKFTTPYLTDIVDFAINLSQLTDDQQLATRLDALIVAGTGNFRVQNRVRNGEQPGLRSVDVSRATGLHIVLPSAEDGADVIDQLPGTGPASFASYQQMFGALSWTAFLADWLASSSTVPMVDQGPTTRFESYLLWPESSFENDIDVDFLILEPNGNLYVPWLGVLTPNGHLTGDSQDTGNSFEGYMTNRFVEAGNYYLYSMLISDPSNVGTEYTLLYRFDQSADLQDAFFGDYPVLTLETSWLADPGFDIDRVNAGFYTDFQYMGRVDILPAGTATLVYEFDAPGGIDPLNSVSAPDPDITRAQLERIRSDIRRREIRRERPSISDPAPEALRSARPQWR